MKRLISIAAAGAILLTGCSGSGTDPDAGEASPHPRPAWAFYRPPVPLPRRAPGTLIRSEPVAAPAGARGWRILYHSRDTAGRDVAVSGSVFVPGGAPPPGGRPVVAWAHGTTGLGDSCAPSTDPDPIGGIEDGRALLAAGDAIVATDYEGLGTPGPHPYLVGKSEAHSVLDAVRAAARLPGAALGRSVVVFGHSQGAHAALFAGEVASSYAPGLRLVGVAAASPPIDLPALARHVTDLDYGTGRLVEVAAGYGAADPSARLESITTAAGRARLGVLEKGCDDEVIEAYSKLSAGEVFTRDPRTTPPWSTGLAGDSVGALPRAVPVLILQGGRDPIIPPGVTKAAMGRMCGRGGVIAYRVYPHAYHNVVPSAAPDLNAWIRARFHGDPAPDDCR
ncbi:lipase family protein [Actinoallomurus rhizosphaericola]|uniref:lipase family protein n=1 Tax=Actinoallomurus rhizosphaericola TaxID=2952536 RepID=UPI002091835D|nr:lipase family protein [Actinoallomurus rhizosphaericola]MCO5992005.1 lipase family protein [Actinoallomurus rhizosphaericola]